jgi:hypothetical protein
LGLAAAGDERRQSIDIGFVICGVVTRLKLRPRLRLLRLAVLVARIEWLLHVAGSKRLAFGWALIVVTVVVAVIGAVDALVAAARLLLIIRLVLPKLLLGRRDQTKVVFRVLKVIFRRNRIARTLRIARKLQIFFGDVRRRAANFYVRSVGLMDPGQWILMVVVAATFSITTAHAFVLTVSHGSLFANPLVCDGKSAVISLNIVTSTGRISAG